jgi:hypothetical protein
MADISALFQDVGDNEAHAYANGHGEDTQLYKVPNDGESTFGIHFFVFILLKFLNGLVQHDDNYVIEQAFTQDDRVDMWLLIEVKDGHRSDDIGGDQDGTDEHDLDQVQVELLCCALAIVGLWIPNGDVTVLEQDPGEEHEEHESEEGAKDPKLGYIYKVFEKLFPPHVEARREEDGGKCQVEEDRGVELEHQAICLCLGSKLEYEP